MGWSFLLAVVLTFSPGAFAQFTLIQPESVSASLEDKDPAQLSCTTDRGLTFGGFGWIQQKGGRGPRALFWHNLNKNKTDFGPEVSSHFSPSANAAKTIAYLTIANVRGEDEGTYYCYAYSSSPHNYVFGGGTQLTVSGQPRVPPNVHVFGPSEEEKKTKAKATITCLMDGFYPGDATVEWLVDGTPVSSGVETARPTRQGDKYVASSYLTFPVSEWEKHETYACKVTHGGEATEKSVRRSEYR